MKSLSIFLISLFVSFNAYADHDAYVEKPFSVGLGIYGSTISIDDPSFADDELSGVTISFGYVVSDNVALQMSFISLEHDEDSSIDSSGYDLLAYFGTGMASIGAKAYIGAGIFEDKWTVGAFNQTFSGLQINGGVGINWESVSLDLVIGIRETDDYEDFVNSVIATNVTATAVTTSIRLSARF